MFYCGRIIFNGLKHADIKGVRYRVTSERSVPCRRALWGHNSRRCGVLRDVTKGVARETALA